MNWRLHLSCVCITLFGESINAQKSAPSNSANGGPYVALEGTVNGGVNVILECAL